MTALRHAARRARRLRRLRRRAQRWGIVPMVLGVVVLSSAPVAATATLQVAALPAGLVTPAPGHPGPSILAGPGVLICNEGPGAASGVTASFVWDDDNPHLTLTSPPMVGLAGLTAGACAETRFDVAADSDPTAIGATRRFHVDVMTDLGASASATSRRLTVVAAGDGHPQVVEIDEAPQPAPSVPPDSTSPMSTTTVPDTGRTGSPVRLPNPVANASGNADLGVALSAPAGPISIGASYAVTMTVTNNGPDVASAATAAVVEPVGTSLSVDGASGCTLTDGDLSCALGDLASGETRTVTFTVIVASDTSATRTVTATVSSGTSDPTSGNDRATATTSVGPLVDLSVTTAVSDSTPNPGQNVRLTVAVANHGVVPATGAVLRVTLPSGAEVASITSPPGGACGVAGSVVSCLIAQVGTGAPLTVTVEMTVRSAGATSVTASVTSAETDGSSADNTATTTLSVAGTSVSLAATGASSIATGLAGLALTIAGAALCGFGRPRRRAHPPSAR